MRRNFVRKVAYLLLALVIFVVILVVRAPIEEMRSTHRLSADTLGDVDPTSSSMVLVLGGLRGIAANMLWSKAIELQREQDWTNLEAVVKSIVKLEPHFISIWTFQGWNLAYNVSVEWDQVEDKYYWIKEGIKFLRRGTEVNEHSPELRWDVGWTYFHKIGKSDEAALLRQVYRRDTYPQLDASGREQPAFNPDGLDNYQASFTWFEEAVNKCDEPPARKPKRMGEVAFRSYPAHAQTNYALGREEEGDFGEIVRTEFERAFQEWMDFADHDFSFREGVAVHLDYPPEIFADLYRAVAMYSKSGELNGWIADLVAGKEPPVAESANGETSDQPVAGSRDDVARRWPEFMKECSRNLQEFNQPTVELLPAGATESLAEMRASFEKFKGAEIGLMLENSTAGATARADFEKFATAAQTLGRLADEELYWCDRYATMINYRYWKERTLCESQKETTAARQHFYVGQQKFREGDPETAKVELEKGLELWKEVLAKFEHVRNDDLTAEETMKIVTIYQRVRQQLDLPELALQDLPFPEYVQRFTPQMPTMEEYQRYMQMLEQRGDKQAIERLRTLMRKHLESIEAEKAAQSPTTAAPAVPLQDSLPEPKSKNDSEQPKQE